MYTFFIEESNDDAGDDYYDPWVCRQMRINDHIGIKNAK
jgi:hypothetical protein